MSTMNDHNETTRNCSEYNEDVPHKKQHKNMTLLVSLSSNNLHAMLFKSKPP